MHLIYDFHLDIILINMRPSKQSYNDTKLISIQLFK